MVAMVLPRGSDGAVLDADIRGAELMDESDGGVFVGEDGEGWLFAGGLGPEVEDGFAHGVAVPLGEVDLVAVEVGDGGAVDLLGDVDDELFGEAHEVVVVGVGLVELEHGELGVVPGADAFVAEVAVDLVDAVEASDDEAL